MKKVIVMLTALCVLALTGVVSTVSAGEVANQVQQECCKCCPDGCTCGDCDCCKAKCNCCEDCTCGNCECCRGKCDCKCGECPKCKATCDCGKCPACKDKKCKCKKSK